MSLALEVCSIAERHVGAEQLPQVVTVGIDVGDAAGVDADSLVFWLETLLAQPPFVAARPVVKRVAGDLLRVSYVEIDEGAP